MKKNKGKREIYSIYNLAVLISVLFVYSCTNNTEIDSKLVFRYNEHKNINSLDPAFAKDIANIWAVNQLFNGLVEMDEQLRVIP